MVAAPLVYCITYKRTLLRTDDDGKYIFFFLFFLFPAGGRNVSHGSETVAQIVEIHHDHVAPTAQVHAQRTGRAVGRVVFVVTDVQRSAVGHVRGHAKLGRGPGTSGMGSEPRTALVRPGLQGDHV